MKRELTFSYDDTISEITFYAEIWECINHHKYVSKVKIPMSNALHSKTRPKLRARLEKIFGRQLIHLSDHGHQDCLDILRSGCNVSVIFDIGANIGQSAIKFCVAFPTARILCFEPVKDTYSYFNRFRQSGGNGHFLSDGKISKLFFTSTQNNNWYRNNSGTNCWRFCRQVRHQSNRCS